jgi:hypothetical protein
MIQLSFFGCSPKKVSWVSSFANAKGCLFLVAANAANSSEHTTSGTEAQPKLKTTMTTMTPPSATSTSKIQFYLKTKGRTQGTNKQDR